MKRNTLPTMSCGVEEFAPQQNPRLQLTWLFRSHCTSQRHECGSPCQQLLFLALYGGLGVRLCFQGSAIEPQPNQPDCSAPNRIFVSMSPQTSWMMIMCLGVRLNIVVHDVSLP